MKKRVIVGLIVGVSLFLASVPASAAIQTFAIGGTYSQGNGTSDIPSASIGLGGAGSFDIDPGGGNQFFDFKLPGSGTFSTINTHNWGYYFLDSYSLGETIGVGNFGNHTSSNDDWDTILTGGLVAGVWGSSHNGYLGFKTSSSLYGYIEYAFTRNASISTITFLSGAYNDVPSADIVADGTPVPVPGAAILGFIGMGTAATVLRRRRKKAVV